MKKFLLAFVLCFALFGFTNVYAAEAINEVTVSGITEPTIGDKVADITGSVAIPDGANYTINEFMWNESENGMYFGDMNNDSTFQNDYAYYYSITLAPAEGYEFPVDENGEYAGTLTVGDAAYEIAQLDGDGNLSIWGETIIFGDITYKVIEGAEQTVTQGEEARFVVDADYYDYFEDGGAVAVDGERLNPANYTAEAGSTVIALNGAYVESLDEGEHNLFVMFNNYKVAETTFTVTKKNTTNTEITPPNTGVNSNSNNLFLISIALISSLSLIGLEKRYD